MLAFPKNVLHAPNYSVLTAIVEKIAQAQQKSLHSAG
jgi:hypothetical protein